MQTLALALVVAAGLWLVGVASLMALRPATCLDLFAGMTVQLEAANWRLQLTEQGLRVLAGAALVMRAPAAKLPLTFEIAGWALVGTSMAILLAPIRWHGRYGAFWIERLTPPLVRALSPVPALAGAGLIYAAL